MGASPKGESALGDWRPNRKASIAEALEASVVVSWNIGAATIGAQKSITYKKL